MSLHVHGLLAKGLTQVPLSTLPHLLVDQLVELHQHQPQLHQLLFSESPIAAGQHRRFMGLEEQLAAQIAPLLTEHPEIQVVDPALAAWLVVHASHELVHDFVIHPSPEPYGRDDFVRHLVRLLEGYLTGPPGRASCDNAR